MYRDDQIKANDILAFLRRRHKDDLYHEELRLSSGFAMPGRIDFWTISPSPAKGNIAISYEVKVSRADFRRDTHAKQRGARLFSDKFFYIAPVNVIPHEQVPDWAGLMEVEWHVHSHHNARPFLRMTEKIPAPKRDKEAPSWGLVCSLIRNIRKQENA